MAREVLNAIRENKEKNKEIITTMFGEGKSLEEIAAATNYTTTTVKGYIYSLCLKGGTEAKIKREKRNEEIMRLKANNWSYQQIAEKVGCEKKTVARILQENGCKPRPKKVGTLQDIKIVNGREQRKVIDPPKVIINGIKYLDVCELCGSQKRYEERVVIR